MSLKRTAPPGVCGTKAVFRKEVRCPRICVRNADSDFPCPTISQHTHRLPEQLLPEASAAIRLVQGEVQNHAGILRITRAQHKLPDGSAAQLCKPGLRLVRRFFEPQAVIRAVRRALLEPLAGAAWWKFPETGAKRR